MKTKETSTLATIICGANSSLITDANVGDIDKYFSERYVVNFGSSRKSGHTGIRGFTKTIHDAFSELSVDVEILVESGNRISWQRCIHGTQTGAFQGFPASGLRMAWRDMVVSEIADGKIAEEWVVTDLAEALLRSRKR
ncbi:MAG: ester cyclase [Pseudomonadota bacterium]